MELRFQRTARCLHLAVLLSVSPVATAANFNVSPIKLEMGADQRAIAVTLSNSDAKPVVIEARAFVWSQADSKDVLTPTTDLIISPPLIEIPPNGTQVIRVGRRAAVVAGPLEKTYRMTLLEVVPAAEAAKPGVHFALRISMPIFIAPKLAGDAQALARPEWTATTAPEGELALTLRNSGNRRLQVTSLAVEDAADKALAGKDGMFYVLAGQSIRTLLKPKAPLPAVGAALTVKANLDAGDHVARVTLAKP
jgi:fimbrial chaperone protein